MTILDGDFTEFTEFTNEFPEFKDVFDKVLASACQCGATGSLKPWPPDQPAARKFCAPCRLKKALAL